MSVVPRGLLTRHTIDLLARFEAGPASVVELATDPTARKSLAWNLRAFADRRYIVAVGVQPRTCNPAIVYAITDAGRSAIAASRAHHERAERRTSQSARVEARRLLREYRARIRSAA